MTSKIYDVFNFGSKLSFIRIKNIVYVLGSYYWSRLRQKPVHKGLPISLAVEPTTSCNLRCPQCPSGLRNFTRPTGMLTWEVYTGILDELHEYLVYLLFYFQGEPYLHNQFFSFVQEASKRKVYTATSTNGHYLSDSKARETVESGLDRLIISIDGTDQETYAQYRKGGNLERVIDGVARLTTWKKKLGMHTPFVIIQFIVFKNNQHQIREIKKLGLKLGVDEVKIKTAQIYDYDNQEGLIPTEDRFSRYKKEADGTFQIKNKLLNHCWKMWHSCVITWDGKVVPCCFDKDAKHQMGDITQQKFIDLWKGELYENFRKKLFKTRKSIDICQNCTEGTKVWG